MNAQKARHGDILCLGAHVVWVAGSPGVYGLVPGLQTTRCSADVPALGLCEMLTHAESAARAGSLACFLAPFAPGESSDGFGRPEESIILPGSAR